MSEGWNKNKFVENIAENIVEFLINSMPDWKCNKFGVETHIKDMIRKTSKPIAVKIRSMPDFVVFNEKTGETFFIEVKYRPNSEMYFFNYLENYDQYWKGTKLIIVHKNKPHFVWVDLEKTNISMRKMEQRRGEWKASWDFGEIEQDIKTLFPDLDDKDLEEASRIIPKD